MGGNPSSQRDDGLQADRSGGEPGPLRSTGVVGEGSGPGLSVRSAEGPILGDTQRQSRRVNPVPALPAWRLASSF